MPKLPYLASLKWKSQVKNVLMNVTREFPSKFKMKFFLTAEGQSTGPRSIWQANSFFFARQASIVVTIVDDASSNFNFNIIRVNFATFVTNWTRFWSAREPTATWNSNTIFFKYLNFKLIGWKPSTDTISSKVPHKANTGKRFISLFNRNGNVKMRKHLNFLYQDVRAVSLSWVF